MSRGASATGWSAGELPAQHRLSSDVGNGTGRDGRWLSYVASRSAVAVGVDDEGLLQKMDDLGVQAAVLGRGALEQEGSATLAWGLPKRRHFEQ